MKRKNKQKGFTLVELIVVVAIIAILAAIAVPNFMGLIEKAETGKDIANATAIAGAVNVFNVLATTPKLQADVDGYTTNALGGATTALDDLWPSGMSDLDVAAAVLRVDVTTEGVATVDRD